MICIGWCLFSQTKWIEEEDKSVELSDLSMNKISGTTWNEEFELPEGSYSVPDFQDHFEYTIKRHETLTDKLPIQTLVNKIQNRITLKIKTGYYLELLTNKTMRPLWSIKRRITTDKNGENVQKLDITEVALFVVILSIINICHSVSYKIFNQQIIFTQKQFIQRFHTLKYGLLIKTLCY